MCFPKRHKGRRHHLLVSEGQIFGRRTLVSTVLGSCVAVTLHGEETELGGILHALLPKAPAPAMVWTQPQPYKYVDSGVTALVQRFARRGLPPEALTAKVFGGAAGLGLQGKPCEGLSVGRRNAEAARETLERLGIAVRVADVGGTVGRSLKFDTATGEVLVKRLKKGVLGQAA